MKWLKWGIVCIAMTMLVACGGSPGPSDASPQQPQMNITDFFPTTIGKEWTYAIEVRDAEPLGFDQLYWPMGGDQVLASAARRRYVAVMNGGKNFTLKLQVKGDAPRQGPLQYPKGVEVAVLIDDLGLYQDAKQVFWAIRDADQGSGFAVEKIVMFDAMSPSAPTGGAMGIAMSDGYTHQMAFFVERPGTSIGFGKEPIEKLVFIGIDTGFPGHRGDPILHFRRQVKGTGKTQSVLDSAFTEDMWFAQGIGMIALEQKVDGKTSMVWTLTNP